MLGTASRQILTQVVPIVTDLQSSLAELQSTLMAAIDQNDELYAPELYMRAIDSFEERCCPRGILDITRCFSDMFSLQQAARDKRRAGKVMSVSLGENFKGDVVTWRREKSTLSD